MAGRIFPSNTTRQRPPSGGSHHHRQFPTLILTFSVCFLVVGIVLTVLAYRPLVYPHHHLELSGSYIAGPFVLVIGLILLGVGLAVQLVAHRLDHRRSSSTSSSPSRHSNSGDDGGNFLI